MHEYQQCQPLSVTCCVFYTLLIQQRSHELTFSSVRPIMPFLLVLLCMPAEHHVPQIVYI